MYIYIYRASSIKCISDIQSRSARELLSRQLQLTCQLNFIVQMSNETRNYRGENYGKLAKRRVSRPIDYCTTALNFYSSLLGRDPDKKADTDCVCWDQYVDSKQIG